VSRISKAIILGIITGLSGLVFGLVPFVLSLEENIGLDLLFKLRGPRKAPPEVIVVSIDKYSADKLNLPNNPVKWPRSLHARITENLTERGAGAIAFDMVFDESRSPHDDRLFANAIRKARNVVLVESIKMEKVFVNNKRGLSIGEMNIEKLVPPISLLAQSSVALAPFPLPKVPVKVSQYWTFKTAAGDTPTLPVVTFQIFALDMYDEFIKLLEKAHQSNTVQIPHSMNEIITKRAVVKVVQTIRDIFESDSQIAERMIEELQESRQSSADERKRQILTSLIRMYQSASSQYLNFYGPPRTVTSIPYYEVLQLKKKSAAGDKKFDFTGKAVFIGSSEELQPEQRDGFYTVFSGSSGLDISGVEIAATAFANLLENSPVQVLRLREHIAVLFLWGVVTGIFSRLFSTAIAVVSMIVISALFFIIVLYQFTTSGIWYPVVVPLLFQVPLAFSGAIAWKYFDTNKERQNIRKAFSYYLPDDIVEQISQNIGHVKTSSQVVYGTCLSTDIEQYTSLSETMDPKELSSLINKYYEAVFEPVRQHGGIVSNVVADSMLALWVTVNPENASRTEACRATLGIAKAVQRFNQSLEAVQLPTRIGLHTGQIVLGSIGAIDHFEYRPIGDIVNTATRIDGLNKHLGTRILVSEDVLHHIDGFLTRELGKFLLVGKSKSLVVHELVCLMEEANQQQKNLCVLFSKAIDAFRRKSWGEAVEKFSALLYGHKGDGPSGFYLDLSEHYRKNPPGEPWDGLVRMENK
jgi:adenylate cyclase